VAAACHPLARNDRRHLLPQTVADSLRRLLHSRCEYIQTHHYTTRTYISLTGTESARGAANWIIEIELSVLRSSYLHPREKQHLISAAETNTAYELTFLHHLRRFEAEADRRRADLEAKEEEGETVDWQAFDVEYQTRANLLLEAYRNRRVPRTRAVDDLLPYVFALTRSRPSPATPALGQPGLDS
jgi:hypothetical protein